MSPRVIAKDGASIYYGIHSRGPQPPDVAPHVVRCVDCGWSLAGDHLEVLKVFAAEHHATCSHAKSVK